MRTGLVLLGAAFLLVGGTALASIFFVPPATTEARHDSSASLSVGTAARTTSILLWGENGSGAQFTLHWQASGPVHVWLWATPNGVPCAAPPCANDLAVSTWNATSSGSWHSSGGPSYPYYLQAQSGTNRSESVQVQATGTASQPEVTGAWQTLVGTIAGGLVLGVGAIALFLGMFLRPGFGSAPPPVPPKGPDGVEEYYRAPPS